MKPIKRIPILDVMSTYIDLVDQSRLVFGSSLPKLMTLRLGLPAMGASYVEAFDKAMEKDPAYQGAISSFGDTALRSNLATYIRCAGSFILGATARALSDSENGNVSFVSEAMAQRLVDIIDQYGSDALASVTPGAITEEDALQMLAEAMQAESFMIPSTQLDARMYQNTANGIVHFIEYVNSDLTKYTKRGLLSILRILVSICFIITRVERNTTVKTWVPSLMKLRITDGTLASIPGPTQKQLTFFREPEATVLSGRALAYLSALADLYQLRLK